MENNELNKALKELHEAVVVLKEYKAACITFTENGKKLLSLFEKDKEGNLIPKKSSITGNRIDLSPKTVGI